MLNKLDWYNRAETAQQELIYNFWNERQMIMNQYVPCEGSCNDHFIYWWHAHVLDALADGYIRSRNPQYIRRIDQVLEGVLALNGGTLLHNYYDDMEWMALALLRIYDETRDEKYKSWVMMLWESIMTAWNDSMGGGMAWKKDQLDYKNTPANAPAAILAARLYQRFGAEPDYAWSVRIYEWNKQNLVDPQTGFVWDGINRLGDGQIDLDWHYTYCQGVMIGAAVELYRITGDEGYVSDAIRTADAALDRFVDSTDGMLPDEGKDDCGLFKGIFVRYLGELLKVRPELGRVYDMLVHNAETMWQQGRNERGLISRSWQQPVEPVVQLCAQLSGIMLVELAAALPPRPPALSRAAR